MLEKVRNPTIICAEIKFWHTQLGQMPSSEQRTSSTGRVRPLARRLDSLAGSPTNSSTIGGPKASLSTSVTPRPSPKSGPSSSKGAVAGVVEVKTEHGSAPAHTASVRDILTQARRREQEIMAQKESAPADRESTGRGRKPVIHTDIAEDSSRKMVLDSYQQEDGYGDIDNATEGSGAALATDKKLCQPLRVPFSEDKEILISSTDSPVIPENDLLLFQIPSLLPTMVPVQPVTSTTPTKKTARGAAARGSAAPIAKQPDVPKSVGTLFSDIPDGRIGTLRVHKSGKTVLRIGDTDFTVNEGQNTNFRTEIACVCPTESEIIFLGQATKRVVVSPVIV
jgi:hypothetical protein